VNDVRGFLVATGQAEAEHRVKGSRFISVARSIVTLADAVEARDMERRRFHDATHHVFAARRAGGEIRFDDDGEPAGTGGRPVLAAIERATGGLGRAYGTAADLALERTPIQRVVRGRHLRLTFAYEDTGAVSRSAEALGATRLGECYGDRAQLDIVLPQSGVNRLRDEVAEATAGRVLVEELPGEMLFPVDT
jgi:putative IMPACT (imprinted ancient) family translation regulator